jgi:hypothetical protein
MGKLLALGLLLVVACAQTPYERCRTAAAFNQDPVARQIELGNCEEIANREAAQQMHAETMAMEKARTERLAPTAVPTLKQPYPPTPTPTTPSQCVVWTPNAPAEQAPFFLSLDALEDAREAHRAGVAPDDRRRLFESTGGVWVAPKTKCRFLNVLDTGAAHVRLLEGEHVGRDGWIQLPRPQTAIAP